MTIRYHLNLPFVLVLLGAAAAANAQVQPQLAARYFKEAMTLCERDAGRLGERVAGGAALFDDFGAIDGDALRAFLTVASALAVAASPDLPRFSV